MTAAQPDRMAAVVLAVLVDERGTPLAEEVRVYTGQDGRLALVSAAPRAPAEADHAWLTRSVAGRGTGEVFAVARPDGQALVLAGDGYCVVALGDGRLTGAARLLAAAAAGIELGGLLAGAEVHRLTNTVRDLNVEAGLVETLHTVGTRLTAELDIGRLVQDATDAATAATGAAFGAFFYNLVNQYGESYTLYTISGVPREAFEEFPMPRNTAVFVPTFDGVGAVRSDDITADPRFGHNAPYHGMPDGPLPVRSYLAVSAVSPTTGEVLGGFFFGHPDPGRFTDRHQSFAEGIAGYAAIALDNARLYDRERNLATELARSMLPVVPEIPHLRIVTRYLPAATGSKVGGDWFDVIPLASGRTAFVIGDVVGHGVTAAAIMGQVRTAIRSYALLELTPSELLRNVSQLTTTIAETSFVTCFYAVHDPTDDVLTYANAGHLPAILVRPDGTQEQIGEALAQPLGVGREFPQRQTRFPVSADLVLYTDGLVETRTRDLEIGIENLLEALTAVRAAADTDAACDLLIDKLTDGRHDDDIALIHVHHQGGGPA